MNKKHPCAGCFYWRQTGNGVTTSCDYILITHTRRPCPPGKDCTVRKRRRKKAGGKQENEAREEVVAIHGNHLQDMS